MKVTIDVDLEKFRYGLVGNGYTYGDAKALTKQDLIDELIYRVEEHIEREYRESLDICLAYEEKENEEIV